MATETPDEIATKVQASLENGPFACSSLVKLTGGTANFVYRGTLKTKLEDGTETVVVKHTEGYVASSPGFKLTDSRCEYERTILTDLHSFPTLVHAGIEVQTPHLYHFDKDTNTQVYSDLPSSLDLKTYVLTHAASVTKLQCERLGYALGAWCKAFHVWGNSEERREVREEMKGNKAMRDLKFVINYQRLIASIESFPEILEEKRDLFEDVAQSVTKELNEKEGDLIHGDFWSGNVLLPSGPIPESSDKQLKVFVIDWEMSQLSIPAFDLGQMIAELYELKHFKNYDAGVWLIESFIKGYGEMDEEMKWKTIIHTGAHLICWGTRVAGWGSKEQQEDVVRVGKQWIINGWERKKDAFEGMVLGRLFNEN
ncbi:uncharacterized protein LY89DRAFT_778327 [Mollisia scopiformis]|uniref:Aminoglycoside phosphotransferase domain-containing protein n=1 Tax=Mollisia scopiformis TaxID=149040 RepID=A0A194XQG8_MOLSC|nr:uncharacterized protein LY89DRAFT_778327 [Mollisia scopiformis]KUJ21982.1 hypothetical protein LY89DRAFT_778327 [Mollisia scopiformis]